MTEKSPQRIAYEACVVLAVDQHWLATANELIEGGFDNKTDFISLLENWKKQLYNIVPTVYPKI